MDIIQIIAILVTLTALLSYVNHRWLKMPVTIALMLMSLVLSLLLVGLEHLPFWGAQPVEAVEDIIGGIDFQTVLMEGMLSFLLFAGALHININDLAQYKWPVGIFATGGVLLSTFVVAGLMYAVSMVMGLGLEVIHCLLFGALISPTDPIAVLGIMKKLKAPKNLETKIAGESLFNDGIGVVIFLSLLKIAKGHDASVGSIGKLFLFEAVGGVVYGLVLGYVAFRILKSIDKYQVEILVTLAVVTGGYAFAHVLHTSGPLAMVVAGLLIGNKGRRLAMSDRTREHLDTFWELIDEILNALLFVLIGLEVVLLTLSGKYLLAGAIAIPLVLFARLITVGGAMSLLKTPGQSKGRTIAVMTWGGLRGGISVALALSLPHEANRELILTMTYVVVAFSVVVQGLTVGKLIRRN